MTSVQPYPRVNADGKVELVCWDREEGVSHVQVITDPVRLASHLLSVHLEAQVSTAAHVAAYAAETLSTPVSPAVLGD